MATVERAATPVSSRRLDPPSAEGELLLLCARSRPGSGDEMLLAELVGGPLDWELVLRLAVRHGAIPALHHRLAACPAAVPPWAMARLRAQFEFNSLRNLKLTAELIRLLELLDRLEIPTLAYKGPTLAAHAYGSLSARQFGDLDLLVRPAHAARAAALLFREGYGGADWPRPAAEREYLRRHHLHGFQAKDGETDIELHWRFMPSDFHFPPSLDAWWPRLERRSLGPASVLALGAEELLVVLCAHGGRHLWSRLKSVCDVAAVIGSANRIDWSRLFDEATSIGAGRLVSLGLHLASDLLDAPLPDDVRARISENAAVPALAELVRHRLFEREICQPASATAQLFYLRARERWREKVPHGLRYVRRSYGEWRHGALTR